MGRVTGVTSSSQINVPDFATSLTYRAFGTVKGINYANGRSLSTAYDNRLRPTTWNVANVLGYNYNYDCSCGFSLTTAAEGSPGRGNTKRLLRVC